MSQTTEIQIQNQAGLPFRQKMNLMLSALNTNFAGIAAPTVTEAYMGWLDTSTTPYTLRYRNDSDTNWVIAPIVAGTTVASPDKATPIDADVLPIIDSTASDTLKKLSWANVKNTLYTSPSFTGNVSVPNLNGGQLAGMRNKVFNGKMEIAQKGSSFPAMTAGAYSLDGWFYGAATTAVLTVSQQSDVPSTLEFNKSLRATVTTADTTIGTTDAANLVHRIEGYNVRDLIGRPFTTSFWVRSSKVGVHCVGFRNAGPGPDRSYITEYTVNVANTWEYKTVSVPVGLITSGTKWDWENGIGLQVMWSLAAGASFHGSAGEWLTGDFHATSNQVNCLDTVGNIFAITGVQLEIGQQATPFEHRPYGIELAICQRYLPVFADSGGGTDPVGSMAVSTSTSGSIFFPFQVTPRVPPTGLIVSSASHFLIGGGYALTPTSIVFGFAGHRSAFVTVTTAGGMTALAATQVRAQNAAARIIFTGCEL